MGLGDETCSGTGCGDDDDGGIRIGEGLRAEPLGILVCLSGERAADMELPAAERSTELRGVVLLRGSILIVEDLRLTGDLVVLVFGNGD